MRREWEGRVRREWEGRVRRAASHRLSSIAQRHWRVIQTAAGSECWPTCAVHSVSCSCWNPCALTCSDVLHIYDTHLTLLVPLKNAPSRFLVALATHGLSISLCPYVRNTCLTSLSSLILPVSLTSPTSQTSLTSLISPISPIFQSF